MWSRGSSGSASWSRPVLVMTAYLVLVLWIIKIAGDARDRFGATVCVGVAAMLFWHVFINVGMVSGLLPVVGVTLPLVSYGGSGILLNCIAIGLLMRVDYENRVLMRGGKV